VLAALGVNLQLTAEQAAACIERWAWPFSLHRASTRPCATPSAPRRELAARTIFNILGPLTNPANATNLLVGVFDPRLTEPMAQVLGQMGARAAFVVHGAGGADELSLTGVNRVSHLHNGAVRTYDFDAQELGLARAAISRPGGRHGGGERGSSPAASCAARFAARSATPCCSTPPSP
jgi:anthranilate phosphoribosyltransferase